MRELRIDGRRIADDTPCFVIAEIGHNHQGSVEKALELFVLAKQAGVDAVKLQKRDNRRLFTRALYDSAYDNGRARIAANSVSYSSVNALISRHTSGAISPASRRSIRRSR